MRDALRTKFNDIFEIMRKALIEHNLNAEHENRPFIRDSIKDFEKRGKELLDEIQAEIQLRLWAPDEIDDSLSP